MRKLTEIERFEKFTMPVTETGCWLWIGCLTAFGYGLFSRSIPGVKKMVLAHRWSYEHFKGPIPVGLVIDHKCRVRACCNPDHLRAVTYKINATENNDSIVALNSRKTHCGRGHEFTKENTYYKPNSTWRNCRICVEIHKRKYEARLRAERKNLSQAICR